MRRATIFTSFLVFAFTTLAKAQDIQPTEVLQVMEKVADWQIDNYEGLYSGHDKPHHPLDWTNGALYVGMVNGRLWPIMTNIMSG